MKAKGMEELVKDYLAKRRALGFALRSEGAQLLGFARYADHRGHRGPLTLKLAVQWARLPKGASPQYWACRLQSLRPFAKYRLAFDPRTEIPPTGYLGASYQRRTPHIYSDAEIVTLMRAAGQLRPRDGLRPLTYVTLLGLLACTGLRISEALRLHSDDVDLDQGVVTVRQSKFKQSRLVPLHPSTVKALRSYSRVRHQRVGGEHFFVSQSGQPLRYCTVWDTFQRLVSKAVASGGGRQRPPRLHDLRHTFATSRLVHWARQRTAPDWALLLLSKYLGHQQVTHSYWYFSAVPQLLSQVSRRFERFARNVQP